MTASQSGVGHALEHGIARDAGVVDQYPTGPRVGLDSMATSARSFRGRSRPPDRRRCPDLLPCGPSAIPQPCRPRRGSRPPRRYGPMHSALHIAVPRPPMPPVTIATFAHCIPRRLFHDAVYQRGRSPRDEVSPLVLRRPSWRPIPVRAAFYKQMRGHRREGAYAGARRTPLNGGER